VEAIKKTSRVTLKEGIHRKNSSRSERRGISFLNGILVKMKTWGTESMLCDTVVILERVGHVCEKAMDLDIGRCAGSGLSGEKTTTSHGVEYS